MLERASRVDTRGWCEPSAVKRGQDERRDQHQFGGRSAVGDEGGDEGDAGLRADRALRAAVGEQAGEIEDAAREHRQIDEKIIELELEQERGQLSERAQDAAEPALEPARTDGAEIPVKHRKGRADGLRQRPQVEARS